MTYEPLVLHERRPSLARVPAQPKQPLEDNELRESAPVPTTLVVTPQAKAVREPKVSEPELAAPALKLESKLPVIPNAPPSAIVAIGTFANSKATMIAKPKAAVETGTFTGGGPMAASKRLSVADIAETGSFDSPRVAGLGHNTNQEVISASGFDNAVAAVDSSRVHRDIEARHPDRTPKIPVEITFKPKPNYTDEGRKQKINGEVRLEVLFKSDGAVRVLRVVQGLGYGLDEQAVKAAEQIKFKPAVEQGQAVDSIAVVHIIFELIS